MWNDNRGKMVNDLVYLNKCLTDSITSEIDTVLRGRGSEPQAVKERLINIIEEHIGYYELNYCPAKKDTNENVDEHGLSDYWEEN